MKYLDKKFSTPANNKAFVDNWDSVFGTDSKPDEKEPVTISPEQSTEQGSDSASRPVAE